VYKKGLSLLVIVSFITLFNCLGHHKQLKKLKLMD